MIGTMPAATPEYAPRPRLASWLIAGALFLLGVLALASVLWFGVPFFAPEWVILHCTWPDPVVRAAVRLDSSQKGSGPVDLLDWVGNYAERPDAIAPYLASNDTETRKVVARAFADMAGMPHSPAIELALLPLLQDPDPEIRARAALSLNDPASIIALNAHGHDADAEVREAISNARERLRQPPSSPVQ